MDQPKTPARHWFQFSLKSILILILFVCVLVAWYCDRQRLAKLARESIAEAGAAKEIAKREARNARMSEHQALLAEEEAERAKLSAIGANRYVTKLAVEKAENALFEVQLAAELHQGARQAWQGIGPDCTCSDDTKEDMQECLDSVHKRLESATKHLDEIVKLKDR